MRVMVIGKASKESESGALPTEAELREMEKFNAELVKAGVLLAAEGLRPSSAGKRVRFSGGKQTVLDGPFSETKEVIAGFSLWQVKSLSEAVEWVKRAPIQDGEVEIRPFFEMEDFAASDPSGELRKEELELRKQNPGPYRVT
jgi:hypothetical protein